METKTKNTFKLIRVIRSCRNEQQLEIAANFCLAMACDDFARKIIMKEVVTRGNQLNSEMKKIGGSSEDVR